MRLISSVLALSLITSAAAFAADPGLLPAGSPAGVEKAQMSDNTVLYILLGAGVIAGIAVAASSGGSSGAVSSGTTTTTTSTSTTG